MSKTISPFLIILTMTHRMKFVSSVAASMFITYFDDDIFSNLHMVRIIYMYTQTCEMAGFQLNVEGP